MEKFNIFKKNDKISLEISEQIAKKLIKVGKIYDEIKPDLLISVGGDGTFLRSLHKNINSLSNLNFISINTGSLGFLIDYRIDQLDELVDFILSKNSNECEKMPLLEGVISLPDESFTINAFNEISIITKTYTLEIDIFIDNKFLKTFYGNGLCFSSSLGSTGYNKSLFGAIVDYDIEAIQITPIAPINNSIYQSISSSIVFSSKKIITLKIKNKNKNDIILTWDHLNKEISNLKELKISIDQNKTIQLIKPKKEQLIEKLNKLIT